MPALRSTFRSADLYQAGAWLMARVGYSVTPVPVLFAWARVKGRLMSVWSPDRFDVRRNIASVFGGAMDEKAIRRLARRHFEYLQRLALADVWPAVQGFAHADDCVMQGLEHIDAGLRLNRGVMLLTSHLGYGRLITYLLRHRGYTVSMVGPTPRNDKTEGFSRFRRWAYQRLGAERLAAFKDGNDLPAGLNVRPLVAALSRNEIIVTTPEGLRGSHLVERKVVGRPRLFSTGALSIAYGARVPAIPVFVVESGQGAIGLRAEIGAPLAFGSTGRRLDDVNEALDEFVRLHETYIGRHPELFHWGPRDFFSKRRLKALHADVADRYLGDYKVRRA
jgi:lauroyl/myristoyl acyltransferase